MVVDKGKKEISPEEQMRRKFRAKCLFRALGRLVMANTYWLIEGVDEYQGVDDVKRRVQQAVRGKAKKKKQLLSIKDKVLLNKHASERTDQEKKYIYRIIGGLKCFKRYPNHVKKKLAAVTYFKYYGPGRPIVRQHQEAHALYFIVTGDVIVSQMIFDELVQQYVSVDLGVMHPGDMFGEVSLLHNIPRTATCTTAASGNLKLLLLKLCQSVCKSLTPLAPGHCELLQLMKEDFKNVLQASIQKQWDEVRHAMSAFTYFDALDEVARREGCIVAKMKSYEANETILGDGVGVANFVYFILSGRCQMIESIQVLVTTRLGKEYYTLYDPYVPKEDSEQDFDKKYFGAYQNLNNHPSGSADTGQSSSQQKDRISQIEPKEGQSILKSTSSKQVKHSSVQIVEGEKQASDQGDEQEKQLCEGNTEENRSSMVKTKEKRRSSIRSEADILPPTDSQHRESVRISVAQREEVKPSRPPNLKTYFMQVCQFNPGSSFGFGENMRDRRIVALTPVDCMLMPMIWLLQRNTANIWTRIQHYLEKKIPSKKKLFEDFVMERNWQTFRDQMVEDVVARSNTVNWTSAHDVPYSIRMEEMLDI